MRNVHSSVLFGRDQHRVRQFSLLAAIVFLTSAVVSSGVFFGGILSTAPVIFLPVVIALGVVMVHAYLNDGLLVTILVGIALGLGMELPYRIGLFLDPFEYQSLSLAGDFYILVFSLVVGIGAFVIGAGIRRVVDHVR